MSVSLDQMISLGAVQIAVLCDCAVDAYHTDGATFVSGQKRPVAILIRQDMTLTAFSPQGDPMAREHVEHLCPGAWHRVLEARGPHDPDAKDAGMT